MSGDEEEKAVKKWVVLGGMIILGCCLGWLIIGLVIACNPSWREGWGQIGDSFAPLNALFSAAAVLGAVYAIFLQRKDFQQTLVEYKETTATQQTLALIQIVTTEIELNRDDYNKAKADLEEIPQSKSDIFNFLNLHFRTDSTYIFENQNRITKEELEYKLSHCFNIEYEPNIRVNDLREIIRKEAVLLQIYNKEKMLQADSKRLTLESQLRKLKDKLYKPTI